MNLDQSKTYVVCTKVKQYNVTISISGFTFSYSPMFLISIVHHNLQDFLNPLLHRYSFKWISKTAFEKIVGKKEIARNQKIVSPFVNIYDIISLFAAEFEEPKISM